MHGNPALESSAATAGGDATLIAPGEVPAVAAMLAASLGLDPAYRFLFPHAGTREARLADFFTRNLRVHLPYRCTRVVRDGAGPLATVTVRPPGGVRISTWTMLRHGVLPMALQSGAGLLPRLAWLKRTYDALEHELGGGRPHWHVHMMAVRPDQQGRGVGGRLLTAALDAAAAETPGVVGAAGPPEPGLPVVLTTHLPENVVFYRRARFAVVDERVLRPPASAPFTVWMMRREGG